MKRLLLYFAALVVMLSQTSCGYNGMVQRDQAVKAQTGNVQSAYQRRSDLIPNLVNTVKGAAKQEQATLTGVIEARAKAKMRGAEHIGTEFDPGSSTYRLKFMREGRVVWIDVDARTGRIVRHSGH